MAHGICRRCGEKADYICERCLRCEFCDIDADKARDTGARHMNRWIWHRASLKGLQLVALEASGATKEN